MTAALEREHPSWMDWDRLELGLQEDEVAVGLRDHLDRCPQCRDVSRERALHRRQWTSHRLPLRLAETADLGRPSTRTLRWARASRIGVAAGALGGLVAAAFLVGVFPVSGQVFEDSNGLMADVRAKGEGGIAPTGLSVTRLIIARGNTQRVVSDWSQPTPMLEAGDELRLVMETQEAGYLHVTELSPEGKGQSLWQSQRKLGPGTVAPGFALRLDETPGLVRFGVLWTLEPLGISEAVRKVEGMGSASESQDRWKTQGLVLLVLEKGTTSPGGTP